MYRGRYQLGQEVPLGVLCLNAADTPTAPDRAPTMKVWDAAGTRVADLAIPALDRYAVTGLFRHRLFLDGRFAAGRYTVTYHWNAGSFVGLDADTFEIAAGGHADGSVVAMTWYHRPQAEFIVQQLNSGAIVKGRNPRL